MEFDFDAQVFLIGALVPEEVVVIICFELRHQCRKEIVDPLDLTREQQLDSIEDTGFSVPVRPFER